MPFELPVAEEEDFIPQIVKDGLITEQYGLVPFLQIKEFKTPRKDELLIIFVDADEEKEIPEREDLELMIRPGSQHIILNLKQMIHTYLLQTGKAEMDEERLNVVNGPSFNFKKISKAYVDAYAYGA